ncbi:MAG: transketolase [Deferribacteres bacterium]|nr:transketolase [candidate division KSB1 bacterium]MCB9501629.1 transketolase [Deferribacteres bacterium]
MKEKNKNSELGQLTANTIRLLAADGVQKANSGHPGLPMGMADTAYVLWSKYLKHNPDKPDWPNRDRFILSGGHGSMLIYSMLHLSGYDVTLDELKQFRQWGSRTAGHPESGSLPGVETTSGPLGQGFANAVGMAIAAKMTAARFNTDEEHLFGNHNVYCFMGDGDMMEGVSSEAASMAGHMQLDNLIVFYDSNGITIEGNTSLAFSESVKARFEAYNWYTLEIDGHNHDEIAEAIERAQSVSNKPTLIITTTHIGFGSPNKQDTSEVHGAPLGAEELKNTKRNLGFPEDKDFYIPEQVSQLFAKRKEELLQISKEWYDDFATWQKNNAQKAALYENMMNRTIPENLEQDLIAALPEGDAATRAISGKIMQKIAEKVPALVGGSADLDPSTKTFLKAYAAVQANHFEGRNFHFGIREHAMGSVLNGISLYGGYIPYGSTFLVFSDYMRPPLRMAALMHAQHIAVFTHDSIFVGEDGPTHQPVEHIAALRVIPNMLALRPADGVETAVCWAMALRRQNGPTSLLLTRQNVSALQREADFKTEDITKGAYAVARAKDNKPQVVLLASGSEVQPAVEAKTILEGQGIRASVVSVPSKELFEQQSVEYQRSVIPESTEKLVVVEAGVPFGWQGYFQLPLLMIGMESFGASGPYKVLAEKYGFTGKSIAEKVKAFVAA